ncbi:hypothetical protein N5T62_05420 [Aliarcobacter cryaerophilus]|uniref:hypothetical protein n=1 Tax=Aliarcobacter cryaerophilus TaxID=28198 RepID=UPI0021B20397|nr:hypothetical protein [Aliarcobacter cryaerophilus]MCT7505516.1 hypothetical protein [Aliarcobacter cryaerophilus]
MKNLSQMNKNELDKYSTQQKKEKLLKELKEILKRNGIHNVDIDVLFKSKKNN